MAVPTIRKLILYDPRNNYNAFDGHFNNNIYIRFNDAYDLSRYMNDMRGNIHSFRIYFFVPNTTFVLSTGEDDHRLDEYRHRLPRYGDPFPAEYSPYLINLMQNHWTVPHPQRQLREYIYCVAEMPMHEFINRHENNIAERIFPVDKLSFEIRHVLVTLLFASADTDAEQHDQLLGEAIVHLEWLAAELRLIYTALGVQVVEIVPDDNINI